MWPARAFDLPHHFEVLFIFLFLRVLLNNPPSSFSPGVHVHPYLHGCPVQRSVYRCARGVCVRSPAGCSTPVSTRPTKYTSGELLALQTPVHLGPELVSTLKSLGIGRRLPRRRSCRGGARKTRAISVVGPGNVRSRPCDLLTSPPCDLSPSTTPASFCHHLPRPPPPPACNPDNLLHILRSEKKISPRSTSLTIAAFNAQSLGTAQKRSVLSHFILEHNIDICFVSETWFRPVGDEAKCRDIAPPGHRTFSFPRQSRGGGIAFIVNNLLVPFSSTKTNFSFSHASFELAQLSFAFPHQSFHLLCLYRPPPSSKNGLKDSLFIEEFTELLTFCNTLKGSYVICGDFNFHYDQPTCTFTARLIDLFDSFGLVQSVRAPTHRRGHIIDWFVHRADQSVIKSLVINHTLPSDHFCLLAHLHLSRPLPQKVYVQARNFTAVDMAVFNSDLSTRLALAPPSSADGLHQTLTDLLNQHAPASTRLVSHRPPSPWFSLVGPQLLEAKRERRRAERQWIKSGLTVHKLIFQTANSAVNAIVHSAKTAYYNSKILACSTSKQLHNITNTLLGKSESSPLPSTVHHSHLPQAFADFFANKIATIRHSLDIDSTSSLTCNDPQFLGQPLAAFHPVSEATVKDIIRQSSIKTCELDPLPASFFSQCLDTLLPYITAVVNNSLVSGSFPESFKSAIVRPVLKKPSLDPENFGNYRPISNLPFLSKITEKVVLAQLLKHLQTNKLLYHLQSAYRSDHSTETALLKICNDILSALDDKNVALLSLLDLSAAFDTIDHSILLSRLQTCFGISGSVLSWFESYFSGRFQSVSVHGTLSTPSPLLHGVPQGSVLGPILFVLYTYPLFTIVNAHLLSHHSFSDDNQLYITGPASEISSLVSSTQSCISQLKSWMTVNKLKLNEDKTEMILISSPKSNLTLPSSVDLNGCSVTISSSVRNLGVTFDQSLSFRQHVANVCRLCYLEIRRISSVRHFLSDDATKTLLCAFVLSRLDYCNALLAGSPKHLIEKLQKVQNHAARLVFRCSKFDHVTPLLHSLHWLPVHLRIDYKISSLCFKVLESTAPSYLSDLLHVYTPPRQLRSSSDDRLFCVPHVRTKSYGQRSFAYQGAYTWNQLPLSVRHSQSLAPFKTKLKTHLFPK